MTGEERRKKILNMLSKDHATISGQFLAKQFDVSRQVIVQDIALLRANGYDIFSTNKGYLLHERLGKSRVFKVIHTNEQCEEELQLIVDLGGIVADEFVYHKVYDVLRAEMNIKSRRDIQEFMDDLKSGKSSLLLNITSGYHYHTVYADNEQILDFIQQALADKGFLAKLQDYEPVDFWTKDT
ncbi:MAG: transcription repressor NadR [Acetatifactor sp.]|nr:transcription repressor NadR [Acetatifactor sp.]